MNSGIYLIKNKITGKVYVGQSKNVKSRLFVHKSNLKLNKHYNHHLQSSVNKYGIESFVFKEIESCKVEELNKREIFWIQKLNSFKNGYNKNEGGSSRNHACKKFRLENILTGEIVEGENIREFAIKRGYGKHAHFYELLNGQRKSSHGWRVPNTNHTNNRQYHFKLENIKSGKIIEHYGISSFCQKHNLPKGADKNIIAMLKGRQRTAYGWRLPQDSRQ